VFAVAFDFGVGATAARDVVDFLWEDGGATCVCMCVLVLLFAVAEGGLFFVVDFATSPPPPTPPDVLLPLELFLFFFFLPTELTSSPPSFDLEVEGLRVCMSVCLCGVLLS